MRILLCPDSFKGSLSAKEVCTALANGIKAVQSDAELFSLPLSDGGEGTLSIFASLCKKTPVTISVHNAYGEQIKASYLYFEKEKTAVIESAQAIGLAGLDKNYLSTKKASSLGVGELIADAVLEKGAEQILLTLGGTATTDGGMGALSALGLSFLDANGKKLLPCGEAMAQAVSLLKTPLFEAFQSVKFYFAADVDSTFYGKAGASYVFAQQKGATQAEIVALDNGLQNLAALYEKAFQRDVQKHQGSGAAGGLLGGLFAAFGGKGVDCFTLLQTLYSMEELLKNTDYILTGEGKTDAQTALAKLPMRVLSLAKQYGVPCILLSGAIAKEVDVRALGFTAGYALQTKGMTKAYAMQHAKALLEAKASEVCRKEMTMEQALLQRIRLLKDFDKMKSIYRQNWLIDRSRREDDASHSWHCAMMAMVLQPYAAQNIDIDKVIRMLLIHDLVEIYAGDTPCYDADVVKTQAAREATAAQTLLDSMPASDAAQYASLWAEFSALETADARYAATIDRLQPLFLNYFTDGASWENRTVKKAQVLKRNALCKETMPRLYPLVVHAVEEMFLKGLLEE